MAVPKRKMSRSSNRSRKSANMRLVPSAHSLCPNCGASKLPHTVCSNCGHYRGRQVLTVDCPSVREASAGPDPGSRAVKPVIALDAMGGDRAPAEIVAGGIRAAAELDVDILLLGQPDAIAPHLPDGVAPDGVEVLAASEVIA